LKARNLNSFHFLPFSTKSIVEGGTIRDISEHQLIRIFGEWRSFRFLSSVEIIREYCFLNCKSLTSIAFEPDSKLL
jgi:hypothetical protein